MTKKQEMLEYMKGKEKVHVKVIADDLKFNIDSVRGQINACVNKGLVERIGKGYYKLK